MGIIDTPGISHSGGVTQILRGRGFSDPQDAFEAKVLQTIKAPVVCPSRFETMDCTNFSKVVEGLFSDKIRLTSDEWKKLAIGSADNADTKWLLCLSRLPDLMQRGQDALENPCALRSALLQVTLEARSLHEEYQSVLTELRDRLCGPCGNMFSLSQDTFNLAPILVAHFSRMYGLGLMVGITINSVLIALDPESIHLRQDSSQMAEEILKLAEFSHQYRPLAAMYMLVCLPVAWVGAIRPKTKADIRAMLLDYQRDLKRSKVTISNAELNWLVQRFNLTTPDPYNPCSGFVEL